MLIIVRGLPGSGKSTYVKNNYPDILHVENDMYFMKDFSYNFNRSELPYAIEFCSHIVEYALEKWIDVVVSNTFIKKSYVDYYAELANKYHVEYRVFRLDSKHKSIHNIPDEIYKRMEEEFEDYPGEFLV